MGTAKWKTLQNLYRRFTRDEDGVSATEYAVLLALIILGTMGVIGAIGESFAVLYTIIADALPDGFA